MEEIMTTLVIGARGHIGSVVLEELVAAGESVRASSRDVKLGDFPADVDVVEGDLSDPATFPAMLNRVRKVFLYVAGDQIEAFAAEARNAGVEHIVLLSSNSVLFPDALDNPTAVEHMNVEKALHDSGIDWTFVRSGYLATNTLRWQFSIRNERAVRTAFPDGSTSLVHERDVASVAARALLDDAHRGMAYLVLGGETLTERDQVDAIAAALGEPVRLDVLDIGTYRDELRAHVPDVFVDPIIQAAGRVPQVPEEKRIDALPELLGRAPLTFTEWAGDHVADFR
jgi:uncharacterized protein YbjT (DUF2867 family)